MIRHTRHAIPDGFFAVQHRRSAAFHRFESPVICAGEHGQKGIQLLLFSHCEEQDVAKIVISLQKDRHLVNSARSVWDLSESTWLRKANSPLFRTEKSLPYLKSFFNKKPEMCIFSLLSLSLSLSLLLFALSTTNDVHSLHWPPLELLSTLVYRRAFVC